MTIRRLSGYSIAIFGAFLLLMAITGIGSSQVEPLAEPTMVPLKDASSSLPEVAAAARPEWEPSEPRLPTFRDGQILNGEEYLAAFVNENAGVNGFDERQIAYLGRESWEYYVAAEKGSDSLFGSIGFDEMEKFSRDWRRLAEANHRSEISQESDVANTLAREVSEEQDIDTRPRP
jgi:hypothetical protein